MNVSKELLSEVLDKEVTNIKMHHINDEYIYFDYIGKQSRIVNEVSIDIYKLAHKCKEWAFCLDGTMILSSVSEANIGIASIRDENGKIIYCEVEDSEPEAVFAACQWVLDNKDKR